MRYWYDTEFIEDGRTIDLISIGVVAEDGREFYAQNQQCHFRRANPWVQANVFPHLWEFDQKRRQPIISYYAAPSRRFVWKTRQQIADALCAFCDPAQHDAPEFWGYYSAYDHVALCQLYGTMIDLPQGWPMYTCDLKQWCDALGSPQLPEQSTSEHHALADARWNRDVWQALAAFQEGITA